MCLRGSNLANTDWALATVVYTGKLTKLMLNSGVPRFKQSRIEKSTNYIVFYLIILQLILCLVMAIFSGFYVSSYTKDYDQS